MAGRGAAPGAGSFSGVSRGGEVRGDSLRGSTKLGYLVMTPVPSSVPFNQKNLAPSVSKYFLKKGLS